jgi:hypothetical protein
MEEMGFDLLRLFGCYFIFKEGNIFERKGWIHGLRGERARGAVYFLNCKPEGLL